MSTYIVYALLDPRPHRQGEIRYIGKTELGIARLRDHLKPSSLKQNTKKDYWLKKLITLGLVPEMIILETLDNPDGLFETEEFWYQYYKGLGCDLVNSTECGKGTRGYKHTADTKKIIADKASIFMKGKPLPDGMFKPKVIIEVEGIKYRQCARCLLSKQLREFSLKIKQNTYQGYCKSCASVWHSNWKETNPSPILPQDEYNASRLPGAHAGGETSKTPERREQARKQRSKAVQGTHIITGEVITFESALHAKTAGFHNTNLGQAIKYNKPYKSYIWCFLSK